MQASLTYSKWPVYRNQEAVYNNKHQSKVVIGISALDSSGCYVRAVAVYLMEWMNLPSYLGDIVDSYRRLPIKAQNGPNGGATFFSKSSDTFLL